VVEVRWLLAQTGPSTQTLTAQRLDDHDAVLDPEGVVTGQVMVSQPMRVVVDSLRGPVAGETVIRHQRMAAEAGWPMRRTVQRPGHAAGHGRQLRGQGRNRNRRRRHVLLATGLQRQIEPGR